MLQQFCTTCRIVMMLCHAACASLANPRQARVDSLCIIMLRHDCLNSHTSCVRRQLLLPLLPQCMGKMTRHMLSFMPSAHSMSECACRASRMILSCSNFLTQSLPHGISAEATSQPWPTSFSNPCSSFRHRYTIVTNKVLPFVCMPAITCQMLV